jgi:hypothetical protein
MVNDISKVQTLQTSRQVGSTGLRRSNGRSPVLEEFLPQLQGQRAAEIYHQISQNSPIIGASLRAISSLMRRAPLVIKAKGSAPRYQRAAKMVEEALSPAVIRAMVDSASHSMLVYGFYLGEIVYAQSQSTGLYVVNRFAPRSPRSLQDWVWVPGDDDPIGFHQAASGTGQTVYVPLNRCLHCRTTRGAADSPEGSSALRQAYSSDYFARRLVEIEAIGLERDLTGLPVIRLPGEMLDPNATPEQKQALGTFQDMLRDIRKDSSEGVILPSDRDDRGNLFFEIDLMSTAGNRQVNISQTIERFEKRVAQCFLTEFLFLGVSGGATGSFALADSKTGMFVLALRCLLDEITDQITNSALPTLGVLNGFSEDVMPTVSFGEIEGPDLDLLSNFVERLTKAGMDFTDKDTQESVRALASLPGLPLDWQPPPSKAEIAQADLDAVKNPPQPASQPAAAGPAAKPDASTAKAAGHSLDWLDAILKGMEPDNVESQRHE